MRTLMFRVWALAFALSTSIYIPAFQASAADENWPQFRGPGARGLGTSTRLPDRWSATDNVDWKSDIPGRGWSSPIVWGNRVFLTTAIVPGPFEAPKKGLYLGGERPNA